MRTKSFSPSRQATATTLRRCLYKFEARIGGGVVCPGAARLLRIR